MPGHSPSTTGVNALVVPAGMAGTRPDHDGKKVAIITKVDFN
jgi:hypothetical protein